MHCQTEVNKGNMRQATKRRTAVREKKQQNNFYKDVIDGLTSAQKYLESKYFYNAEGDRLFQEIMHCPEYYITRCEAEILKEQSRQIVQLVSRQEGSFDIVELGAGDA